MALPRWWHRLERGSLGDIVGKVHAPKFPQARFEKWAKENKVGASKMLRAYEFYENMAPELGALLDSGDAGFVRDDLFEVLLAFVLEDAEARNILDLMHGVLSEKHYELLEVAVAADNLRRQGADEKSKRLIDDASMRFGEDARKINSLYSAGYVLTVFAWQHAVFRSLEDDKRANARFKAWFEDQLKFFDQAIFVNEYTTPQDITEGIAARILNGRARGMMRIWAAGVGNVRKTLDTLDEMIKVQAKHGVELDYGTKQDRYGKAVAVEFVVFHKGQTGMKRSRLPMLWEKGVE
jgi:hypothetical protein